MTLRPLALIVLPLLMAMGAPEAPSWTGQLAVVGNEPFTFLALTESSGRQWRLSGDLVREMAATAQGRWVKITGRLEGRDGIFVESWTWAPEANK